ncbi:MAG: thermonuclease family protein [Alphaproteobacteria bacterium]|nr:thermonuclease family protein [Alphaproteobacteria bacterium]
MFTVVGPVNWPVCLGKYLCSVDRCFCLFLGLFCGFVSLLGGIQASAADVILRGPPSIILGDVLEVEGKRVRLVGIDAPEEFQKCRAASGRIFDCGHISATALMDLTAGVKVSCLLIGKETANLPRALCRAGGYDLSKGMVHSGWALAVPRTGTIYGNVERTAREGKHGLWRGKFDMPWDWRNGAREAARAPAAATQ